MITTVLCSVVSLRLCVYILYNAALTLCCIILRIHARFVLVVLIISRAMVMFLILAAITIGLQWLPEVFPRLQLSSNYYLFQTIEWWLSLVTCVTLFVAIDIRLAHVFPAASLVVTGYANYHKHRLLDLGVLILNRLKKGFFYHFQHNGV